MKHWFHAEARVELLESVRHYEGQRRGLGRRFLEAVAEALRRIDTHPNMFPQVRATWRRCRVSKFPFGVVYRVGEDKIEIIAVMHLHREPGYWSHRGRRQ